MYDCFRFISCEEKPAMSRRQVGSTRRNGSFPFAGAFNSKSKSSPLLSIGLVVVVIVLGFNVQFFVCEFDCNVVYLQWMLLYYCARIVIWCVVFGWNLQGAILLIGYVFKGSGLCLNCIGKHYSWSSNNDHTLLCLLRFLILEITFFLFFRQVILLHVNLLIEMFVLEIQVPLGVAK